MLENLDQVNYIRACFTIINLKTCKFYCIAAFKGSNLTNFYF